MALERKAPEKSTPVKTDLDKKSTSKKSTAKKSRRRPSGDSLGVQPTHLIAIFLLVTLLSYLLMVFTGDKGLTPKLGIDLQGGTRVTLTPRSEDGKPPSKEQLDQAKNVIESRVNGLGVSGSEVVVSGQNLVITVPGQDGSQARSLGQTARLLIRPVEQSIPAPQVDPNKARQQAAGKSTAEQIAEAKKLRQRPANDPQAVAQLTAVMPQMDCSENAPDPLRGNDDANSYLVACGDGGQPGTRAVYLLAPKIIDGRDVANAEATIGQDGGAWIVSLEYKGQGEKTWSSFTTANVGKQTAFVLDSDVVSAPSINEPITGGRTQVTGNFTQTEATNLANVLKFGSLPLSFDASSAETVSATLGLASMKAGLIAGVIGLLLVLIYSLLYYRMLGVLVLLSLVCSGVLVYSIMVLLGRWIGFTLDLSGIAGLIIGIGMTADSFVVYFERIKDEMREGRSFRSAVPRGWARARRTIWSGNAVSFLAAAVLYVLAIGEVRGFAFTLGLTTILDVFVVFLVTHPLVHFASKSKFWSKPSVNGLGGVSTVARQRRHATKGA